MNKYLLLAYTLICIGSTALIANAADLPSDAIRQHATNAKVDVLLKISYETEDQASMEAFRKALADQKLHYTMEETETKFDNKTTMQKWKMQVSRKVDPKDNHADQQVSSLYDSVKSKTGSFSWTIATTPK
ncbi:hypothetical protein ACO0LG_05635 [Undibacterium sp. Ji42W]|uniref:hypothetical protein n=1 Tax=Undibacterium sp. Ji42W TaxID=3413039 RepID=UPI003BF17B27